MTGGQSATQIPLFGTVKERFNWLGPLQLAVRQMRRRLKNRWGRCHCLVLRQRFLCIDDVQARVGTKGALVRPGRKPDVAEASVRPTILPYAGLRTAPAPASLAAELRRHGVLKGEDCGQSTTPSDGVYALDTTHTLVLLECGSGAYNLVQRAFLVLGGKAPTAQPVAGELGDGLANADFDPRYRTLGGLAKGRGAGDCGTIDRWVWTGKGFLRVQRSVMAVCRGVPPQWWITVERSAIAVAL